MPAIVWNFSWLHGRPPWHNQIISCSEKHMIRAIKMSYLVLVDEEQHDGQNLQEEDDEKEDEELWRHKGKKGRISKLFLSVFPFISTEQTITRAIMGIYELWSVYERREKVPDRPECERQKEKDKDKERELGSAERSKSYRLFSLDISTWRVKRGERWRWNNHSKWDRLGKVIYSIPLSTFEFVKRSHILLVAIPPPLPYMADKMSCLMGDTSSSCGPMWVLKTVTSSSIKHSAKTWLCLSHRESASVWGGDFGEKYTKMSQRVKKEFERRD